MRSRRRASQAMTGMNLTSLLDITFCLLIAFMVVAPALTRNMEIELPEAKPPARSNQPDEPKPTVTVTIEYGGTFDGPHPLKVTETIPDRDPIERSLSSLEELKAEAENWHERDLPVVFAIDWRVPFGIYIQSAAKVREGGITRASVLYKDPRE